MFDLTAEGFFFRPLEIQTRDIQSFFLKDRIARETNAIITTNKQSITTCQANGNNDQK